MFSRIWQWFASWFTKTPALPQESFDLYFPSEREIYTYSPDGIHLRKVDPLPIYKRIMAIGPELSVDIKVSKSPMKDASKAHDEAIRKIREVFDLVPLDQGGLTEQEAMDLLNHFLAYCDYIKKNSSQYQTSPATTSSPISPPSPPSGDAGSTHAPATMSSSDSGSTDKDSSTAMPVPSPLEQESPSEPSIHHAPISSP